MEHDVAHDPYVVGMVAERDPVMIFVGVRLPVSIIVDSIVVKHDVFGHRGIVLGIPATRVQPG